MLSHFLNSLFSPHTLATIHLPLSLGLKDIFKNITGVTSFIIPIFTFLAALLIDETLINLLANTLTGSDSLMYSGSASSDFFVSGVTSPFTSFMQNMPTVFNALTAEAFMIAGLSLAVRVVKTLFDKRQGFNQLSIFDSILRFGVFAMFVTPVNGSALAYDAIKYLIGAANLAAQLTGQTILNALGVAGKDTLAHTLDHILLLTDLVGAVASLLSPTKTFMLVPLLIFSGLLLYVLFISLSRFLYIGLAIAFAPLCLAVGVYDFNNPFTRWWKDMFVAALFIPIVAVPILALSIGVASTLKGTVAIENQIIGFAIICVGFWFTGHSIHKIATSSLHNHTVAGAAGGLLAGSRLSQLYGGGARAFNNMLSRRDAAGSGADGSGGSASGSAGLDAGGSPASELASASSALPSGMELEPTPFDAGTPAGRVLNGAVSRGRQVAGAFGGTIGGFEASVGKTIDEAGPNSYQSAALQQAVQGTEAEGLPPAAQVKYAMEHADEPGIQPLMSYFAESDEAKGSTGPVAINMGADDFQRIKTQVAQARGDV